jgi:hypothetical protein|tara:strand:- start:738 stop:962 length:225 start_codon:yes stop_codon:yes gene_type:complete
MTVKELIEMLVQYNPQAEVKIMSQPNNPLEYRVEHACSRAEISDRDGDYDDEPDDVFIVEGSQLGYGSKKAWNF